MTVLRWLRSHLTRWNDIEVQQAKLNLAVAKENRALAEMNRLERVALRRAHR